MRRVSLSSLAIAVAGCLALGAGQASASDVSCGDTITKDTKLDSDLIDCPGDGIIIGADNIRLDLEGHTISGVTAPTFAPDGVDNGAGYDNLTVVRGTISGFPGDGVFLDAGADAATLRGLTLTSNSIGVEVISSSGAALVHNDISDNRDFGIVVVGSTNSVFAHNRIAANGGDGLLMRNATHNRFEKNEVVDSGGLQIQESHDNRFKKNTLKDNDFSIGIFGGARNQIDKNVVSGGGDVVPAIFIQGDDNEVTKNLVFDNDNAGIGIVGNPFFPESFPEGNVVSKNEVRDNEVGIGTRLTGATVIEHNTANHNLVDGIAVNDSDTTITKNRANDNGELGIDAVTGVIDGGGNRANGNGDPAQCTNVACK